MRVVIASRIFAPEPAAAAFRLAALAEALSERGAEVTVLTTRAVGAASDGPGVRVRRWPVLRDRSGYVRGYLQYLSFDVPLFFRLLLSRRPDVVVVEPPPTTGAVVRMVCALKRVPYVYYAADVWSDAAESTGAPRPVVRILRAVERQVLGAARRVLAVNAGVADRVRALSGTTGVITVGNGVDTRVFTPDGPHRTDGGFGLYAGTTSEWQGADIFLRAMPTVLTAVPDARLVFLGQGSAWQALKDVAAELALTCVEFHPVVPPAEAAQWLRSARFALVSLKPGQGYDFAFPTKIYAASATGTPVVYAGPGPAGEVIGDAGLGRAVPYDLASVAAAMIAVFREAPSPQRTSAIAEWARQNVSLGALAQFAAGAVEAAAGERVP